MGRADFFDDGTNNYICDQCGKKFKARHIKKQWDGLYVCKRCYDPRHPQEFVRGVPENAIPDITSGDSPEVFTEVAQSLTPVQG